MNYTERKIKKSVLTKTQPCFTPFATSNAFESSPLKPTDTLISIRKLHMNLTKGSKHYPERKAIA